MILRVILGVSGSVPTQGHSMSFTYIVCHVVITAAHAHNQW